MISVLRLLTLNYKHILLLQWQVQSPKHECIQHAGMQQRVQSLGATNVATLTYIQQQRRVVCAGIKHSCHKLGGVPVWCALIIPRSYVTEGREAQITHTYTHRVSHWHVCTAMHGSDSDSPTTSMGG